MKNSFFPSDVAFVHNPKVKRYCLNAPFNPPAKYPELSFIRKTDKTNMIYPMVRELFIRLKLDSKNIGNPNWNPLVNLIKPGDKVLIKPNLVKSDHFLGEDASFSLVVHGSVIRPIIDYVSIALKGKGSIIIADNPVERSDFVSLMNITGIQDMVDELCEYNKVALCVIDLRPKILKDAKNGTSYYISQSGDPLGYVTINLGRNSLFAEFDENKDVHFYTLADKTVNHFDPKYADDSVTDKYHNANGHKYVVSKSVLDTDVIINISKLKTHCKAGVTLALKNMIGMVYQKDCLPHHRPGFPPNGDSFPAYPSNIFIVSRKIYHYLRKRLRIHHWPGFKKLRNSLQQSSYIFKHNIEHGNWKGNDTIWRTILDLNRIAVYADENGIMRDQPQRNIFALIDGIIGQQGDGPINGEPIESSIIIGGVNPVIVDALAVKSMGIDPKLIKTVWETNKLEKWRLLPSANFDLSLPEEKIKCLNFKLPHGWRYDRQK